LTPEQLAQQDLEYKGTDADLNRNQAISKLAEDDRGMQLY
jgi:hypothetical protein